MVGLRCAEVSPLAWDAIAPMADAAMTVSEDDARQTIARLAAPQGDDPEILAGASGVAGAAALMSLATRRDLSPLRDALKFGAATRALVIATEGPSPAITLP